MKKYKEALSLSMRIEGDLRKGKIIDAYEKLIRLQNYLIEWDEEEITNRFNRK